MQTIDAFDREFPDETACKDFLVSMRWPDGVRCPRCKRREVAVDDSLKKGLRPRAVTRIDDVPSVLQWTIP